MSEITPGFRTMFDEAQKQLDRQFKSFANLREYAKTVISISSIIVSFFATFKASDIFNSKTNLVYVCLFFAIILVYGILMILAIRAVKPYSIASPIKPDANEYDDAYADKTEFEIIGMQIALYLKAIKRNEKIIAELSNLSNWLGYLLALIVLLILMASISLLIL